MRMLHSLVSKILELWHKIPGIRGAVNRLTACFHENSSVHGWNPDVVFLASFCWSDMRFWKFVEAFNLSIVIWNDSWSTRFRIIFIHFPRFLPWNMAIFLFFLGLPFSVTTLAHRRSMPCGAMACALQLTAAWWWMRQQRWSQLGAGKVRIWRGTRSLGPY